MTTYAGTTIGMTQGVTSTTSGSTEAMRVTSTGSGYGLIIDASGGSGDPLLQTLADQDFHHVVGTFGSSGCRMTLYVDGVEAGTNDDCVNIQMWPRILIGASTSLGEDAIHATIADVAIYGAGLPAARVLAHYQA